MLAATRMTLGWRKVMVAASCLPLVFPNRKVAICGTTVVGPQQRRHVTLGTGDGARQQPQVKSGEAPPPSTPVTGECNTATTSTSTSTTSSDEEALGNLLEEIQVVLSRPVPIGSLFRALSSTSKKTLVKSKIPLEQLLLQYPQHFMVYQQGSPRNRMIYCSPPHLVPANVRPMINEQPPLEAPLSLSSSFPASASASASAENINSRILQHDPLAEKQQRINAVLQYIPNEWSPFTELGIPEEVRVKYMGKPAVKAIHFFEKYPQYFEIRQQSPTEHTFYVRRSLALQRSLDKTP